MKVAIIGAGASGLTAIKCCLDEGLEPTCYKRMKVAIIGAGASGLTAIKCCLDEGLEPTCYERSDDIGGLWRYSDEVKEGQASVMKSTVINTSKEMMCYSDFPIPSEYPIFMHNKYVQKYFHQYADHFMLRDYIKFETEVLQIKRCKDFSETGKWDIRIRDKQTGETQDLVYDAVLLASGHHAEKHKPTFPGLDKFKGQVIHTHDYKHPKGFEDKRVVIIGIGNSGGDLAVEMSRNASQVFLSTRRGSWIINRVAGRGMPVDMQNTTRFLITLKNAFPYLAGKYFEFMLNQKFDHSLYSLKPKHDVFAQHPMVNDDLPNRIICGSVAVKPNVATFTETGVKFKDGTFEDNIDAVFLATGYVFGFPYLEEGVVEVNNNEVELFKYAFPLTIEKPTLAVIGCVQPYGAIMPISELQCRLATRVFKGKANLPSKSDMKKDIVQKREDMAQQYIKSQRHTIQVDYIGITSEIAELIGCKPDIGKIFLSDPRLALHVLFGPCTPYQYRLQGPLPWSGARKAILSQWDRTLQALKTRPLDLETRASQIGFAIFLFIFVSVFVFILSMFM